MARQSGFVTDTASQISGFLDTADRWSGLKEEWEAMTTNGTKPTQADVDIVFGAGVLTLTQYEAAIAAMQTIIDSVHVAATRAKLYRMKR